MRTEINIPSYSFSKFGPVKFVSTFEPKKWFAEKMFSTNVAIEKAVYGYFSSLDISHLVDVIRSKKSCTKCNVETYNLFYAKNVFSLVRLEIFRMTLVQNSIWLPCHGILIRLCFQIIQFAVPSISAYWPFRFYYEQ